MFFYYLVQVLRHNFRILYFVMKKQLTNQALKGILTAGPAKAVKYSSAKLKKMMKSLMK